MRLVIFDMDGTLIDSERLIVETLTAAFGAVGEAPPSVADIRRISGITSRDAMKILRPDADAVLIDRITDSYRNEYLARAGVAREPLFEGALAALDRLQADPHTILAIATGKGYRGATTLLERHGIIGRFHSIQTPDHNRGKPDPQMIESAMTAAGVTKVQTAMIGDTVHDMHMVKAAGVRAIGVAWGYHATADLEQAGADVVLTSFDGLDAAIDEVLGAAHA